ncbi:2-C-methyl-D-erythritol 2,4-cyclodiphosphate synthase, chloroplastic [Symbiodinium microadriaticum]|uniref:2-C-methyl-D-erythritol 2,4-cyclodiphosphate synthase, chloroplastic n=1 Tax=Symbiodinium microadriaticum TaxID=2951 RepID=A0A1Q9DAA0_SYMMI|nr:2-C-methyl-D-erythritol 2,4-cyclodiphosphate synthase, chloroplastic [Symbiodinium microadriaticum]
MGLRGYRIGNVDVTIIAEKPRLAARKADMKDNLVRICDTIPARVNLKARTHEKMDSVGELERRSMLTLSAEC